METDILEISSQVNDEFTLMALFFRADLVVKLVILMLFAASIFSWAIIIQKIRLFRNLKKLSDEFDSIFWSGKSIKEIQVEFLESESFPVKNVFDEALKEIKKSESEKSIASLPDRLDTVIESSIELESEKLSSLFNYLATIGSTSPFIGLFGTVWGIMNSFQSIAISKNTSLAVVAPGIAEALFATALGLLAAIPAVIAYNLFTAQVNKEAARMYRFKDQFKNIFLRGLDKKKVN
ncbi:protein TolQ [Pelagibacteraceae bacterium]|nr:protein TolQ [Pelagibacteraceae bacterium]